MLNFVSPNTIGIELVRGCNFKCNMCPVPINSPDKFQFMSTATLKKIMDQIEQNPTISTIWLFNFGEPLAHPEFEECLRIVHTSQVARTAQVIMHTNASLLLGKKAKAILEIPIIKKLVFSFDGFGDKESFEMLRGPHYDKVMKNIQSFSVQANKLRPDLLLSTCSILPKENEIDGLKNVSKEFAELKLKEIFEPLNINVETRELHDYSGNDDLKLAGKKKKAYGGCSFIEDNSLYLTANGLAAPCCAVFNEKFNVGSISDNDFISLLNNKESKRIRHLLRLDKREEIDYCKNCSLSIGGFTGDDYLRRFWFEKYREMSIFDKDEISYIFDNLLKENIQTTNDPKGFIDRPTEGEKIKGKYLIEGWALDGKGISKIEVWIDGQKIDDAVHGYRREGFKDIFPEYLTENAGFLYWLTTDDFSNGLYTLEIKLINIDNKESCSIKKGILIEN